MPRSQTPAAARFKRPYSARRARKAAGSNEVKSPANKLLLRVLAVLVLLLLTTVVVIVKDLGQTTDFRKSALNIE